MEDFLSNNSRLTGIIDEANRLWTFFQRFIDEHATDRQKIIRSELRGVGDKMNAMEWLSRYSDYVSPDQIGIVLSAFKD